VKNLKRGNCHDWRVSGEMPGREVWISTIA